jgi:hypothetical protein
MRRVVRRCGRRAPLRARLLVSGKETTAGAIAGWIGFEVKSVLDYEVVVIGN